MLEEVEFADGTVLMEAGAVEDWLFVVVEGEVEVVREDRWIRMGPGSVVGEMAAPGPPATVGHRHRAYPGAGVPAPQGRVRRGAADAPRDRRGRHHRARPPAARDARAAADPVRTRLLLLAGQTVRLGLMMAFLVVPVSALFLDEYGAGALPYVYLTVAVAGVAVSSRMSRAQRRVSLAATPAACGWIYLVVVAAGWFVLTGWDGSGSPSPSSCCSRCRSRSASSWWARRRAACSTYAR